MLNAIIAHSKFVNEDVKLCMFESYNFVTGLNVVKGVGLLRPKKEAITTLAV